MLDDAILIRNERPEDIKRIRFINQQAFGRPEEAQVVDRVREQGGVIFSLVASIEEQMVGHILFSTMTLEQDREVVDHVVALGPVAVLPEFQKQAVGSTLIWWGLKQCESAGHQLVFLVGHPSYYPRFGFVPAQPLGFTCAYLSDEGPNDHFMLYELQPNASQDTQGFVRFHPAFDGV